MSQIKAQDVKEDRQSRLPVFKIKIVPYDYLQRAAPMFLDLHSSLVTV